MYQIISCNINAEGIDLKYKLYATLQLGGSVSYSIQIEKGEEVAMLRDAADSYKSARELFDMLVHGSVTPVTAFDILEDWLLR